MKLGFLKPLLFLAGRPLESFECCPAEAEGDTFLLPRFLLAVLLKLSWQEFLTAALEELETC